MHKKESKKLKEVKNDSTYSEEQRQLYRDKQARLKILSQNRKDLQMQVARTEQTIDKCP